MKKLVWLLLVPVAVCAQGVEQASPQGQRPKVVNIQVEGNLAPTSSIECIDLPQANSSLTPPDLHTGLAKCIAQGEYEKALRLFVLAGIYSRFDAERVADVTARDGGQVLIMQTTARFTPEQRAGFSRAADRLGHDPVAMASVCADVRSLGFPSYFPRYLVLHGMNAFMSRTPLDGALLPGFDAAATWARLQDTYLHCPQ